MNVFSSSEISPHLILTVKDRELSYLSIVGRVLPRTVGDEVRNGKKTCDYLLSIESGSDLADLCTARGITFSAVFNRGDNSLIKGSRAKTKFFSSLWNCRKYCTTNQEGRFGSIRKLRNASWLFCGPLHLGVDQLFFSEEKAWVVTLTESQVLQCNRYNRGQTCNMTRTNRAWSSLTCLTSVNLIPLVSSLSLPCSSSFHKFRMVVNRRQLVHQRQWSYCKPILRPILKPYNHSFHTLPCLDVLCLVTRLTNKIVDKHTASDFSVWYSDERVCLNGSKSEHC